MKTIYGFILLVSVCCVYVYAESCNSIQDCVITQCIQTSIHSHMSCDKHHCTCREDARACITQIDCVANARCVGSSGHLERFHCLDGACQCI
ncbi:serine protease inhibitor Cvsi-2-like [Ruditapes philippinarum]|uniref:serine protease inhibitor Cvsi-2-like n=1 Tax=Ruditapes philippinarum TaxID=129788 RepID=UPI00295BE6AF|nr:serine protease inhibitor Cvsi-2-like [Ruditapes philippinarum]